MGSLSRWQTGSSKAHQIGSSNSAQLAAHRTVQINIWQRSNCPSCRSSVWRRRCQQQAWQNRDCGRTGSQRSAAVQPATLQAAGTTRPLSSAGGLAQLLSTRRETALVV